MIGETLENPVSPSYSVRDLVNEVCALVKKESRGNPPTVSLSPEVAEMLECFNASSVCGAAQPAPADGLAPNPDAVARLDELNGEVAACRRCALAETRTNTVFGSGNPGARLVFVGEAPGRDEDLQGLPFVGRAGQLLTDIIEKGMGLKRSEVFICNVLKCRPPENRNPLAGEVEQCEPYLIRQLELIRPRVICALGTYAAQTLLKTEETIGRLRGRWHFYHGIPLRATYHPAYLLRNPADKRKTWDDVLEVMKVYNGEFTPEP